MKKNENNTSIRALLRQLDPTDMLVPLFVVTGLCVLFILAPGESTRIVDAIRGFLATNSAPFTSSSAWDF